MITLEETLQARERIEKFIKKNPLKASRKLDEFIGNGNNILYKPELLQPTNSFKIRNALAVLTALSPEERKKGVLTASTGNLGQALAWGGKLLNIPVTVCVKHQNNHKKNQGIRSLGAELIEIGMNYDETLFAARKISAERHVKLIKSTENKDALAGAATLGLEIAKESPDLDAIFLAVGSGSHAAAIVRVFQILSPKTKIIGVQSENACAAYDLWHRNKTVRSCAKKTIADAIAICDEQNHTVTKILRESLYDFITVSENQIIHAMRLLYKATNFIVEGAGAAGLAGLLSLSKPPRNKSISIVLTGGNLDPTLVNSIIKA